MKINFKKIIFAIAAFGACACTIESIDPLTGEYAAPVEVELTTLSNMEIVKYDGYRTIDLTLTGGQNTLKVQFLSNTYYLKATTYTPAVTAIAKPGNWNSDNSSFNGEKISLGGIEVSNTSDEDYTISGTIQIGDNTRYRFNWAGKLQFEKDPEPVKLTKVLSAQSNVASGTKSVTMNLATAEVSSELDMTTYQTVYKGEGFFAAIDIYSEDGYLHEGTYKPCATGGDIHEGEYGIGWDPGDLWGIGMVFENWGTCWWTVENGTATAQKINSGDITVTRKGTKYVVEYNNYDANGLWFVFEGEIEAIAAPADGPTDLLKMVRTVSQNVTDEQNVPVPGFDRHDIQLFKGEEYVAEFDLVVTEGSDIAGEYSVAGYPHADHVAGNGWDASAWGFGKGGTIVVVDGTNLLIQSGKITVTRNSDGSYTFTGEEIVATDANYTPVESFTSFELSGTEGEIPGPVTDQVILTNPFTVQNNVPNGTNSVTLKISTPDVTYSFDMSTYQEVYTGTGFFASMDIYSADGTLAEGTYTACATGGVIGPGEFGIGYDAEMWGMLFENWGTCWWTVTDGVISAQKISDGTITVSKSGDNYIIEYNGSIASFKYEGPLAL